MPKTEKTKEKLLRLLEILKRETDDDHHLGAQALLNLLEQQGIQAERKSLYRDIDVLRDCGYDVLKDGTGYFLPEDGFSLPELKLLADTIQCSRFLTEKKSYELIDKLSALTSRHRGRELRRQLHLVGRSKAANEQIYYNIDAIYSAMAQDREITFDYLDWHSDGKRKKRDEYYRVSPYALCWESENYYLVGHRDPGGRRHFRVDRMENIRLLDTPRQNRAEYQDLDMASYSKQVFGMYGGQRMNVRLQFEERLAGNAVDKFGSDVMMIPGGDGTFTITREVDVSRTFYAWVFSFGGDVKILAPEKAVREYREMLQNALSVQAGDP